MLLKDISREVWTSEILSASDILSLEVRLALSFKDFTDSQSVVKNILIPQITKSTSDVSLLNKNVPSGKKVKYGD